jgi:hypothetical protein
MPNRFPPIRTLMVLTFLTLLCSVPIVSTQQSSVAGAEEKAQLSRREREQTTPVDVAPEPTGSTERAMRLVRNRLHNDVVTFRTSTSVTPLSATSAKNRRDGSSVMKTLEELPEGVPSKVVNVDLMPMTELPAKQSEVVVVGYVKKAQPYFSEDKRNIYTEYTISIVEVLRNATQLPLRAEGFITSHRLGGALKLASGRVIRLDVSGYGAPITADGKFVLFLGGYDPRGDWFHIYKPWELTTGVAVPLDPHDVAMAQAGRSQFAGMNEGSFIIAVRDAIQRLPARP